MSKTRSIYFPDGVFEVVRDAAKRSGVSFNNYVLSRLADSESEFDRLFDLFLSMESKIDKLVMGVPTLPVEPLHDGFRLLPPDSDKISPEDEKLLKKAQGQAELDLERQKRDIKRDKIESLTGRSGSYTKKDQLSFKKT